MMMAYKLGIWYTSVDNSVSFKDAWKTLRRAGWFSKPPKSGLEQRFRYVRPGGNPNGIEGDDFFQGERALTEFFNKTYLDDVSTAHTAGPTTEGVDVVSCDEVPLEQLTSLGDGVRIQQPAESGFDLANDASKTTGGEVAVCETERAGIDTGDNVQRIRQGSTLATVQASSPNESVICAVCKSDCSTSRSCTNCGAFLHHFCSHDVCAALQLRGPDGLQIWDFGEASYCSEDCYKNAAASSKTHPAPVAMGVTSLSHDQEAGQPRNPSSTDQTEVLAPQCGSPVSNTYGDSEHSKDSGGMAKSRAPPKISKASKPRKVRAPTRPKKTAGKPRGNATSKKGATSSKSKKPTASSRNSASADAYRNELLLRVQAMATKFVSAQVAFSPGQEDWMKPKHYCDVGAAFLVGVVTRYTISNENNGETIEIPTPRFEIRWTNTAFQTKNHVHQIDESVVCRGVKQFVVMQKHNTDFGETWSALCTMLPKYSDISSLTEEFEEIDESGYREWSAFRSHKELHIDLCPAEVEAIQGMSFSPTASLDEVPGLYANTDGSTTTHLRNDSKRHFGHSATASFFAFLPLSLWQQVVVFSNDYAAANCNPKMKKIDLDELMKFLGILWYMALVDKGEMRNYWLDNEEDKIFPGASSTSMSSIMSWRRFLYIRSNLRFRGPVTSAELSRDPAAKIRPLISILKKRCCYHVIPGRNVAVDEASIACRSKYARHLIVYNPRKPSGKYHFKLYVCCCSTSWIVINFKLHCSSDLNDRLDNVVSATEIERISALTKHSSEIRKHVIEVTSSLEGSRRIVNTDNFYTSCLLLESLRTLGLYCRGTVRASSKHFPRFTMIESSDRMERGCMKQGVCLEKHIVAASWVDGSIVNVVSNADDSGTSTVYRRIKQNLQPFKSPKCVREYNSAMQGVDRHDQLRGRFSVADGHSFKKWHKKLAMAMIDIARCNAYVCHQMATGSVVGDDIDSLGEVRGDVTEGSASSIRDPHRTFVASLVKEMFDGSWRESLRADNGMLFTVNNIESTQTPSIPIRNDETTVAGSTVPACTARESWIVLKDRSRAKRECTVCRFECRRPTQKTDYCEVHKVALCKRTYPVDRSKLHLCQMESWSCWQKYHEYYLPNHVYNHDGNLMRGSSIYKAQAPFISTKNPTRSAPEERAAVVPVTTPLCETQPTDVASIPMNRN